jgi:hypothetical protein
MLAANASLYAYNTTEYLKDMGTVERYHGRGRPEKRQTRAYNFRLKSRASF